MIQLEASGSIAVVDVETTGLFPQRYHRVIEVAAVVVDPTGQVEREFATLVNPERDLGPNSIHGVEAEEVAAAPTFPEAAGLLIEALSGTVAIAAHNARFDRDFLRSEFGRMGEAMPDCWCLCTRQLSGGRKLRDCCRAFAIDHDEHAHQALADARAAAQLLGKVLAGQPEMVNRLAELPPITWPDIPCSGVEPITRQAARRRLNQPPEYLQRLVRRRRAVTTDDEAVLSYSHLLDQVLEDRIVEATEAEALIETAERWGLDGERIEQLHRDYLRGLADAAWADGVVTKAERRDLELVARLLGQRDALPQIMADAEKLIHDARHKPAPVVSDPESLQGLTVCFTGELRCTCNGEKITRASAERMAAEAGLQVARTVTKKLDLLIVADPQTQSSKAKKARQYGTRVMQELVFWKSLGVEAS